MSLGLCACSSGRRCINWFLWFFLFAHSERRIDDRESEQDKEHHERQRRGGVELAVTKGEFVQPSHKNIRAVGWISLGHYPNQRERVEDIDRIQNQYNVDERAKQRQRQVTPLLPRRRPIDLCRFE